MRLDYYVERKILENSAIFNTQIFRLNSLEAKKKTYICMKKGKQVIYLRYSVYIKQGVRFASGPSYFISSLYIHICRSVACVHLCS